MKLKLKLDESYKNKNPNGWGWWDLIYNNKENDFLCGFNERMWKTVTKLVVGENLNTVIKHHMEPKNVPDKD